MSCFYGRGVRSASAIAPLFILAVCACVSTAGARLDPVTLQAQIIRRAGGVKSTAQSEMRDNSDVVLWLTPVDKSVVRDAPKSREVPQLVQHNKSFEPHVLVVEVGTAVQFPNKDPFFHNVFSLFEGKRFDLGLYEAGSTRSVRFDRPGVSFLFCNIHAEMSAVVIAVDTPYFAKSDPSGSVTVPDVPDGRYRMHVWYERSVPEDLKPFDHMVEITDASRTLQAIQIPENPNFSLAHKNKYGLDYVPPPKSDYQP